MPPPADRSRADRQALAVAPPIGDIPTAAGLVAVGSNGGTMPHLGETFFDECDLASIGFHRIGTNVRIKKNAGLFFVENISIGNNVRIDDFTIIVASREPVSIGDHVHIAAHCYLSASDGLSIGDYCTLAPGVSIFTSSDDYSGERMTNVTLPKQFTGGPASFTALGRHAIVGAHSVILPGASLGEGVAVGAQSLVTKPLAPWGIYAGAPARRLRDRSRHLLEHERVYLAAGPGPVRGEADG